MNLDRFGGGLTRILGKRVNVKRSGGLVVGGIDVIASVGSGWNVVRGERVTPVWWVGAGGLLAEVCRLGVVVVLVHADRVNALAVDVDGKVLWGGGGVLERKLV